MGEHRLGDPAHGEIFARDDRDQHACQGVAPDGLDLFDVTFTKRHVQWWIAPLTADGRTVWVGFARARN